MNELTSILVRSIVNNRRITPEEAFDIYENAPWTEVVEAADAMRKRIHPHNKVGYTAFRIINYTNICSIGCSFCSFKEEVGSGNAYVISLDEIRAKTQEAKDLGATTIFFQGGVNSAIPLQYYLDVLNLISKEFKMDIRGFSPVEIKHIAENNKMSVEDLLMHFKVAGLGSVPGAGAEIMTENMRAKLSPKKLSAKEWCDIMGKCHKLGLPGSANIVVGSDETTQDIIDHLNYIRIQQDLTGGFLSFVPWTFQARTKDFFIRHVPSHEYLKLLALSRLFLDNIPHIEVSVLGMGKPLGELGLRAGADDINSIVIEENVLDDAGIKTIAEAKEFIENANFEPYYRRINFD